MISQLSPPETTPMFQLKGGLYTLTALQLLGTNLASFESQLEQKIQQAPKFFHNAPVVIDLQKLNKPGVTLDFKQLQAILLKKQLIPIGVKGGNLEQQTAATEIGLPILQENIKERAFSAHASEAEARTIPTEKPDRTETEESEVSVRATLTKVITEPVRGGQQIYVQGGDLIVLAPVSHGAELLAEGNIHVYGPLRGRALAGVTGDHNAHIFCQSLEAELISIAGQYKISEDINQSDWRLAVDIYLEHGRLHIRPL